ncbi:MAG: hypothetical protein OEZ59_03625 [Deltaproteobacteria bacterium]|nr:hypothetical protein [Deltaproteobacteria bacterium]
MTHTWIHHPPTAGLLKNAWNALAIPAVLVFLAAALSVPVAAQEEKVTIDLQPLAGGTTMYKADRVIKKDGGRITETTLYNDLSGKTLVETVSVFEEINLAPVSYTYRDNRNGESESMTRRGGQLVMSYSEKQGARPDSDSEDLKSNTLLSAAVSAYILRNREALQRGQVISFGLVVISRQDIIGFRVQLDKSVKGPPGTWAVRMDPDSWVIRKLVDPLFFFFENAEPYRLLEFKGRAAVKTAAGKNQDLKYVFQY